MKFRLGWPSPSRLLLLTFALLISFGTALLLRSECTVAKGALSFIDALFTSTSAICVTGLVVKDTGTDFTFFGQFCILLLIQLGGLGILTISNWTWLSLTRRVSPYTRLLVTETVGLSASFNPRSVLKNVLGFTLICEGVGTILLSWRFAFTMSPGDALWNGVFHSVSAFCNAGFGLFSTGLSPFSTDLFTNVVIMLLIIFGGLGFLVAADATENFRKRGLRNMWSGMAYQSRVVVLVTVWLIVIGAGFIMLMEWSNALHQFKWYQRPLVALFQSVTSRTAGFNTLSISSLTNTTLMFLIILMMIGASPGSTGGGIKTTTFAVLWAIFLARMRDRNTTEFLDRTIAAETHARAITVTAMYIFITIAGVMLLELSEFGFAPHNHLPSAQRFLDHLFEVVSALGTVGLSTGVTPSLTLMGKTVIILCMFAGRVGPLILAQSLVPRRVPLDYKLPAEKLMIG